MILFCLIFGLPIVGSIAASKITAWAGCSHGTFDMPPQCGPGIIQDRFAPLSSWAGALLTPIFFVSLFWDWILMWSLLIAPLAVWSYRLREHERKEAQYE
ncbi:MAG TPA: hypothetical protein VHL14_02790 [Steroidobacteraceae bacterium]|nr:hypothetical protein [Steroidobacteraceae bacterium]